MIVSLHVLTASPMVAASPVSVHAPWASAFVKAARNLRSAFCRQSGSTAVRVSTAFTRHFEIAAKRFWVALILAATHLSTGSGPAAATEAWKTRSERNTHCASVRVSFRIMS